MAMSMFGRGAKGAAGMAVKSMQNSTKATGFKASYKMADTQKINLLLKRAVSTHSIRYTRTYDMLMFCMCTYDCPVLFLPNSSHS